MCFSMSKTIINVRDINRKTERDGLTIYNVDVYTNFQQVCLIHRQHCFSGETSIPFCLDLMHLPRDNVCNFHGALASVCNPYNGFVLLLLFLSCHCHCDSLGMRNLQPCGCQAGSLIKYLVVGRQQGTPTVHRSINVNQVVVITPNNIKQKLVRCHHWTANFHCFIR